MVEDTNGSEVPAPPSLLQDTSELVLIIFAACAPINMSLACTALHDPLPQDTSELVLIIFAAWALVEFKNRVLHWVATNLLMAPES